MDGQIIKFGEYEWLVVEVQSDRVLMISKDIIQIRKYHEESNATWCDCSLRKYLNNEFYYGFSKEDREKIIKINNKNLDNPWFKINGGEDTDDSVFLFSLEDVCRYFGDSNSKLQNKNDQDMIDDANNINRIAKFNGKACWWWLRSVGHDTGDAARVSRTGRIDVRGDYIDDGVGGGVRPALWLNGVYWSA